MNNTPEITTNDIPLITIPVRDLIGYLSTYKYRDNPNPHTLARVACLSRAEGEWIKRHDLTERYCHVEFKPESPNVCEVWLIDEWKVAYERFVKQKEASERSRKNKETLEQMKLTMAENVMKDDMLSVFITNSTEALRYVEEKIVRTKKYNIAAKFGCSNLEELLT